MMGHRTVLEVPQGQLSGQPPKFPRYSPAMRRPPRRLLTCEYELQKLPGPPPLPPPPPPPPMGEAKQLGRRSALVAVGSLVAGVQVARWLVPSDDAREKRGAPMGRNGQAANPWGEAWKEARGSDVMDRDGLVSVRRNSGEWLFLQPGPNSKAFTLEGEFGERYQLQTDKEVSRLTFDALQRIFARHDLWEPRLQRIK